MDRIEKIAQKLHWNQMTLKKTLAVYILIALAVAVFFGGVFIVFFENWKEIVLQVNHQPDAWTILYEANGHKVSERYSSEKVARQIEILSFLEIAAVFLCGGVAVICVSHQYYKRKLEEPLKILKREMEFIGRDDLSFDCSYISNDEMGEVCNTLNRMRKQLVKNQENLWHLMEAQRNLNAAFAHDIRTPLTVMRGYTQMMLKFYPEGKISEEKMIETLQMLERQTGRIEQFSLTMKEIHNMEEWKVDRQPCSVKELAQQIRDNLKGMPLEGIQVEFSCEIDEMQIICDKNLIQEVADNILANALRYAKEKITISMVKDEEGLFLYVKDDGKGFSKEEIMKAARPYFSTAEDHFGLGLTICQTLCKKHGGDLELMNSLEGGAIVSAYFMVD